MLTRLCGFAVLNGSCRLTNGTWRLYPPERVVHIRLGAERVAQPTDVFAAADGTLYLTDTNGGLTVLAHEG
jgi:hypothetical protein